MDPTAGVEAAARFDETVFFFSCSRHHKPETTTPLLSLLFIKNWDSGSLDVKTRFLGYNLRPPTQLSGLVTPPVQTKHANAHAAANWSHPTIFFTE